jgi:thiol:disulfide interchange protein
MMSRFLPLSLIALLLFFFQVQSFGQLVSPPKWTIQLAEKDLKVGQEAEIVLKASIPMNWYIYSNDFDENAGPVLTTLSLEGSKGISVKEKLSPINPKKKFDKVWEADITYFSGIGEFRQKITITEPNVEIKGVVEYQMCSDVTGQCILYEEDFTIKATAVSDEPAAANATTTQEPTVAPDSATQESTVATQPTEADSARKENRTVVTLDPEEGKGGLIGFMFVAFLAGLAALLTPCVFPMIPMTVTFFTGRAKSRAVGIRNAFIYGLSIIAIYTIAGTAVAAIQGPEFANWLSTHWVPNVFFFLVFIVFAMAFLGMFELTLPSSFVNKIDAKSDKGGLTGVFFMAFTLVLVSFSCTGPIVGSILIKSAGGDFITPIAGMFAFSLAFAIPFTLFAIFPEWLNSLPKSGGWLNSVKVVLGFLELALAFKFLSIADQVYHWGILDGISTWQSGS